jgi:hypothetical protein
MISLPTEYQERHQGVVLGVREGGAHVLSVAHYAVSRDGDSYCHHGAECYAPCHEGGTRDRWQPR